AMRLCIFNGFSANYFYLSKLLLCPLPRFPDSGFAVLILRFFCLVSRRDEHDRKDCQKQETGHQHRLFQKPSGQSRSRNGSYDKEENDAIVLKTFIPRLFILIYI